MGYLSSSIGRKQLIAASGLAMVLFLIAHLSGNLLIYSGPEALNNYSYQLHSLGPILWIARLGLIAAFVTHFGLIALLVKENYQARGSRYAKAVGASTRNLATQTMRYSGLIIFIYIGWHLVDYTFTKPSVDNAIVAGEYLGLYGLVWNSFQNPLRAIFYVVAMLSICFHLNHGIQSTMQSFGFNHPVFTPLIKRVGIGVSLLLAVGFSMIPIYVYFSGSGF